MTIKQQTNHEDTQKLCQLHNEVFSSIHLRHTLPTLLYHLPCVIKNIKPWDERNEDCLYMWLLQSITLYQRR